MQKQQALRTSASAVGLFAWLTTIIAVLFTLTIAFAHAGDSFTLRKGDRITHAAGNLWRIEDSHGRVKDYVRKIAPVTSSQPFPTIFST